MTLKQAVQLRSLAVPTLAKRSESIAYAEIFLNIGKAYHVSLEGWNMDLSLDTTVVYASGGIGRRARQMRNWLIEKTMGRP
jgi:hypothetical protein